MLSDHQTKGNDPLNLILWRHADAEDGIPDMDRRLTDKGIRQAKLMAAWLKARLPKHVRVLVSPAARARQTADALEMEYSIMRELAPGADAARVLAAAGWPLEGDNVLIVGHQPTLGSAASLLIAGEEMPLSIKKGAIFWIARRDRETRTENVVRAVLSPELIKV